MQLKPLISSLYLALLSFSSPQAASLQDRVFFDEDDSIGSTYYDASFGFVTPPSSFALNGPNQQKLIVETAPSFRGTDRAVLTWNAVEGGNWRVHIAAQGWTIHNLSDHTVLVLHLNGPDFIEPQALPQMGLETASNMLSKSLELGSYLEEGLDADPLTWQKILIPLEDFNTAGFSRNQVKDVFFSQLSTDNREHTLWIDDLRASTGSGEVPDQPVPDPPAAPIATAGDRSVMLNWAVDFDQLPAGYHVYRSPSGAEDFTRITFEPLTTPGFGDALVENETPYDYRITAVNLENEESEFSERVTVTPHAFDDVDDFLDYVQKGAFHFFWYEANPVNGLIRDRSDFTSASSIASIGFGLSGICIGTDHGWITRQEAAERVFTTLNTLISLPQNDTPDQSSGYRGWFYHFLDMHTGLRARNSELSSIDTGLLLAGIIHAWEYFDAETEKETAIRKLASDLFDRVDWSWMLQPNLALSLGWFPENGFIPVDWVGYNEAMILYILGMGHASDPLPEGSWTKWTSGYTWETHHGQDFVPFPPLFGHQYSHAWIDFRHITDTWMKEKKSNYFINSRRATLAQREYAVKNKRRFPYYSDLMWGFTACDGPGTLDTHGYIARGAPPNENDDGTIAPTAVAGSMPFAPEVCIPTLRHFYDTHRENIWTGYGFTDAFNPSVNWWGPDVIGIDQGAILLMIENYRNQGVWSHFMKSPIIQRGLQKAGFKKLKSTPLSIQRFTDPAPRFSLVWPALEDSTYFIETSTNLKHWHYKSGAIEISAPPTQSRFTLSEEDTLLEGTGFFRVYGIEP